MMLLLAVGLVLVLANSVHFLSGKPGGGKSLYGVKLIVDELVMGTRVVITNVPLNLPALNEYLQRAYPRKSINLFERVRMLDDAETGRFWTIRPGLTAPIEMLSPEQWKRGDKPDYSGVTDTGVFYVIDEVHNFFNARAWMETGRDVLFYLSQHRHLGDDVIPITQHVGNVDKQFRSVTQDYTYLRNLSKERMGLFRLPARFIRKTYGQPATDTSAPMETGTFALDVTGLASCYDTAKGVGIHSRSADQKERRTGLHWAWFAVGCPALLLALFHYGPVWIAHITNPNPPPVSRPAVVPAVAPAPQRPPPARFVPASLVVPAGYTNRLRCVGKFGAVPDVRVLLSDGSIVRPGDGRLTSVSALGCVVDGLDLRFPSN